MKEWSRFSVWRIDKFAAWPHIDKDLFGHYYFEVALFHYNFHVSLS